jgi:hypothetical protein
VQVEARLQSSCFIRLFLLHQKLELGPAIVWFGGTSVQCGAHSSPSILGCVVTLFVASDCQYYT